MIALSLRRNILSRCRRPTLTSSLMNHSLKKTFLPRNMTKRPRNDEKRIRRALDASPFIGTQQHRHLYFVFVFVFVSGQPCSGDLRPPVQKRLSSRSASLRHHALQDDKVEVVVLYLGMRATVLRIRLRLGFEGYSATIFLLSNRSNIHRSYFNSFLAQAIFRATDSELDVLGVPGKIRKRSTTSLLEEKPSSDVKDV
ncbi:hypothetical protein Fmac_015372 [Flemingia macrophylla]|uniref:Ribosomal protein S10 n=1 Tax=Flemingia macrophylla TaxID=520843 RepID=A0ABD1MEK1_9FABA